MSKKGLGIYCYSFIDEKCILEKMVEIFDFRVSCY